MINVSKIVELLLFNLTPCNIFYFFIVFFSHIDNCLYTWRHKLISLSFWQNDKFNLFQHCHFNRLNTSFLYKFSWGKKLPKSWHHCFATSQDSVGRTPWPQPCGPCLLIAHVWDSNLLRDAHINHSRDCPLFCPNNHLVDRDNPLSCVLFITQVFSQCEVKFHELWKDKD